MSKGTGTELREYPINLGRGATAEVQPEFTGDIDWYMGYGERVAGDGVEARLVSMHTFNESWDGWEMHPEGAEVVICTEGKITLIQESHDGTTASITLTPGQFAINPPGVWHTADVEQKATAVFITAGMGTEQRTR